MAAKGSDLPLVRDPFGHRDEAVGQNDGKTDGLDGDVGNDVVDHAAGWMIDTGACVESTGGSTGRYQPEHLVDEAVREGLGNHARCGDRAGMEQATTPSSMPASFVQTVGRKLDHVGKVGLPATGTE